MKYLGIDYGSKHIGLALSNSDGTVAMPRGVYPNDTQFMPMLEQSVRDEQVQAIVVGESHNLDGGYNAVQTDINQFIKLLEETTGLVVVSSNELFSSRQAKWGMSKALRNNPRNSQSKSRSAKQESRIDDKAAAIILQSYLDSRQ